MKLQIKHGTAAEVSGYTGPEGELIIDDDNDTLYAGDNTPGGQQITGKGLSTFVPKPIMQSPLTGESLTYKGFNLLLQGYTGPGLHTSTIVEVASDSIFSNIITTFTTTTFLTELNVPLAQASVSVGNVYYVRVKYTSSVNSESEWSDVSIHVIRNPEPLEIVDMVQSLDFGFHSSDLFGGATAISDDGNILAVGASSANYSGKDTGLVLIFRKYGTGKYKLLNTLEEPTPRHLGNFGRSLAITGDGLTLFIATYDESLNNVNTTPNINDSGYVYVYKTGSVTLNSSYILSTTITIQDTSTLKPGTGFSLAATSDGSMVAVSSLYSKAINPAVTTGSVDTYQLQNGGGYVYLGSVADDAPEIVNTNPVTDWQNTGYKVMFTPDDNYLLISAPAWNSEPTGALPNGVVSIGAVHIVTWDAVNSKWAWIQTIVNPDTVTAKTYFGRGFACNNDGTRIAIANGRTARTHIYKQVTGTWQLSHDLPFHNSSYSNGAPAPVLVMTPDGKYLYTLFVSGELQIYRYSNATSKFTILKTITGLDINSPIIHGASLVASRDNENVIFGNTFILNSDGTPRGGLVALG